MDSLLILARPPLAILSGLIVLITVPSRRWIGLAILLLGELAVAGVIALMWLFSLAAN